MCARGNKYTVAAVAASKRLENNVRCGGETLQAFTKTTGSYKFGFKFNFANRPREDVCCG